mmetsp:Transcript_7812/g.19477  ORF Transcript_7812/g.19477 Transcript_7812/m.19477 type:complete len:125 (-) Transcript_7812:152-526(-)
MSSSSSMAFLRKLNGNQKVWGMIGGVIVAGTVFKVAYFRFCREMIIEQQDISHLKATEHYAEAKEFAKWSAKDREERRAALPKLSPEQEKQMKQYIKLMQEYHAMNPDSDLDPITGQVPDRYQR